LDFINHYAETAFRLVTDRRNRSALQSFPGKTGQMILVEQYLLTACLEYHRERKRSPYRGIDIRYVFDTIDEAYRPERATEAGFTHLASDTKKNARICYYLERRLQQDLPEYHELCMKYVRRAGCSESMAHFPYTG
jgi:hypothetical protein